jgi:hypothetical protein
VAAAAARAAAEVVREAVVDAVVDAGEVAAAEPRLHLACSRQQSAKL